MVIGMAVMRIAWHGCPQLGSNTLGEKTRFRYRCESAGTQEKVCHNCDTKPAFTVETDFIDRTTLLILRNLLKTKSDAKISAYRLARYFFQQPTDEKSSAGVG
jgi:hypothetical protein